MGLSTEQTVAVIEAVKDKPNYLWQILVGVAVAVFSALVIQRIRKWTKLMR